MYLVWTVILIIWYARTVSEHCKLLDWHDYVWWNWNDMCNVWVLVICNHFGWDGTSVIRLKGNQFTIVTYVSICSKMIELVCYVWWLSYRHIYNYYGWNEISVYWGLKRNQGTIVTFASICFIMIGFMYFMWWLSYSSYVIILVEIKLLYWDWKKIKVPWLHMHL